MEEKIELTQAELEYIKDNERFKERTTVTLKHLCRKMDRLSGIKTHVNIQWFLISGIILSILYFRLARGG